MKSPDSLPCGSHTHWLRARMGARPPDPASVQEGTNEWSGVSPSPHSRIPKAVHSEKGLGTTHWGKQTLALVP